MSKSGRGQKKGKRTGLKLFFVVMIVVVLAAGGYAVAFYHNFASSAAAVYKPVGAQPVRDSALLLEDRKPISILLMGIDNGAFGRDEDDGKRSDAMIVVTLNPKEHKTTMVSIPRDTFTEIVGNDSYDKITHAYWYGGAEMCFNTVPKMLDIPIDYYICVYMAGIQKIVDAVGGIDVAIDQTFTSNGIAYAEGLNRLDGAAALKYSRIRNDQTEQDTGRQARQRRVIQAIANKVLTMGTLLNNQKLLQTFVANVETNFQTANYLDLQRYGYAAAAKNIKQEALGGVGGLRQDRGLLACGR